MKRRTMLKGVGLVGASATLGGLATWARFGDQEYSTTTFTASNVDLKIGYKSYLNGNKIEVDEPDDRNGMFPVKFHNLKPCDTGRVNFGILKNGQPIHLFLALEIVSDRENKEYGTNQTPSEDPDTDGELEDNINVNLYRDDDHNNEPDNTGLRLMGYKPAPMIRRFGLSRNEDGYSVGVVEDPVGYTLEWEIPCSVGNEIQGDSFEFAIFMYATQERNNQNPQPQWPTPTPTPSPTFTSTSTTDEQ